MMGSVQTRRWLSVGAVALTLSLGMVEQANARRGGSFGSRGMRTYAPTRSSATAPGVGPVQRSMTPNNGGFGQAGGVAQRPGFGQAGGVGAQANRGGFLRRWGGPLLGGLALGGLMGMMMGHGFGGAAGFLGLLLQVGIIALIAMVVLRLFRRRREESAMVGADGPMMREGYDAPREGGFMGGGSGQQQGGGLMGGFGGALGGAAPAQTGQSSGPADELGLTQTDFDAFEQLLRDVQGAFGREDYTALRERTTPEVMSYLSEELSQNAVTGKRNEVRDVRLLQGDLAEAWREEDAEYATVAIRYASIDVTRDRASGRVLEGDADRPTETKEVWTFVRQPGAAWRLSAIQDAANA